MATLDYTRRLANLQNRRFDRILNESLLSKSFSSKDIPDNVKYLVESMRPLDNGYNAKTVDAADRVQTHLERGLDLHFQRDYRTQGSITTATNIKTHSDYDLLAIISRYHFLEAGLPNDDPYTLSIPEDDIIQLRNQATKILKEIYTEVDDSGQKCISIFNKSLNRKVDIVFAFWHNTRSYQETQSEDFRGIHLFDFPQKTKVPEVDFPFAHISQVNLKGQRTWDGSKKGIRLLKTLRADSEPEIQKLKPFHLTAIVHAIPDSNLMYHSANELTIAKSLSGEMQRLVSNPEYRRGIKSPNGRETPLQDESIVPEIVRLKEDLDILIEDASKEVFTSPFLQKVILSY